MRFCRGETSVSFLEGDGWLTAFCKPSGVVISSIFSKLFLVADPWAIFSDISPEERYLYVTFLKEKTSNLLLLHSETFRCPVRLSNNFLFKSLLFTHIPKDTCCCLLTQSCPALCDPMDCSTSGFPVLHCFLEFAQTHVHWAVQPAHLLSPPSPPALNFQGLLLPAKDSVFLSLLSHNFFSFCFIFS